jgi:alpha-2-macroglobulin
VRLDGPTARVVASPGALATAGFDDGFGSPARTTALVLGALVATRPDHPLVTPLALGLVAERRRGTWRTTQETAWALLALDAYQASQASQASRASTAGAEEPRTLEAQVSVGDTDTVLSRHSFVPPTGQGTALAPDYTADVPMPTLLAAMVDRGGPVPLTFAARGGGTLHYQARLTYAPTALPTNELDAGIELHRRYRVVPPDAERKALDLDELPVLPDAEAAAHVPEGAFLVVDLTVTTGTPRRALVLADPLPGGFEAAEADLRREASWRNRFVTGTTTRIERRDEQTVLFLDEMSAGAHRFTYLVRATTRGRFVVPPARIEGMYEPEIFGRTATRFLTIDATPARAP